MNSTPTRVFHKLHCYGIILFGAILSLAYFVIEPANWGTCKIPLPNGNIAMNWQLTIGGGMLLIGGLALRERPPVVPSRFSVYWFLKGASLTLVGLLWLAGSLYRWRKDLPVDIDFLERASNGPGDLVFETLLSASIILWGAGQMLSRDQ